MFKLATAFTHPRRVEVFRSIHTSTQTFWQLQAATGISASALERHLRKLKSRGLIECQAGHYVAVCRGDAVGRKLAELAVE